jgi:hypothetical protein
MLLQGGNLVETLREMHRDIPGYQERLRKKKAQTFKNE